MLRARVSPGGNRSAARLIGIVCLGVGLAAHASVAQKQNAWFSDTHAGAARPAAALSPTGGGLTVYPALADFLAATTGTDLAFEDFDSGFAPPNGMRICFQAVASTSDDPCFAPGDLVAGFSIRSSGGNIWDPSSGVDSDLIVIGPGMRGLASAAVGANVPDPPENPTQISFDNGPTAVAMDVYDSFLGQAVQIEAYDDEDQLIGVFTALPTNATTPAFAGFTSPVPVKRVAVNALSSGGGELIDNLYFGGGAGRLQLASAAPDFDAVALGGTATAPVTLSNGGRLDLLLGTIPAPDAPFSIATDGCSGATLAPGASCVVEFAFMPAWAGNFSAELDIPAEDSAPIRLALSGQGVRARVSPMPGAIDFGSVAVGGTSNTLTVTLANLTGASFSVSAIDSASAPFSRVGGSCAAPLDLDPGEQCTLDFSFAPTAAGRFDATVTITGNGVPATAHVNLHGIGGQP